MSIRAANEISRNVIDSFSQYEELETRPKLGKVSWQSFEKFCKVRTSFFWSLFALVEETVFWTEEVENEILRWNDEKNKLAEVIFSER